MKDVPALPPSGFPHWLRNVRQVKFCTIWLFARIMRQMRINRICPSERSKMVASRQERVLPNFRQGDAVVLYERNTDTDNVTNKMVF